MLRYVNINVLFKYLNQFSFPRRDLGEHGFLVEGSLLTCKSETTSVSIPYKYVVYKSKMKTYEYEFIYKQDSAGITNRCLFVKSGLLNDSGNQISILSRCNFCILVSFNVTRHFLVFLCKGDWHQYDDIICAETSKIQKLKKKVNIFGPTQKQSLKKGRQIAGNVMLETIFELLRSWTEVNLKSFWIQLRQFFEVYSDPFVYEEKVKKWLSLGYGKDDVSSARQAELLGHVERDSGKLTKSSFSQVNELLKDFMDQKLICQQQGGGDVYGLDPLRAAVVMLSVCQSYKLNLKDPECYHLCAALRLPQMKKEDFLKYWADFSQEVPFLRLYVFYIYFFAEYSVH